MDPNGSIHVFGDDEQKSLLEKLNGPLVPIDEGELESVVAMNREMRRKWYQEQRKLSKKKS